MLKVTIVRLILLFLGLFEFFAAWKFHFYTEDAINENVLLSTAFMSEDVKVLFICYVITLGIARLSFVFGEVNVFNWLALIGTHIVEALLWWRLMIIRGISSSKNIFETFQQLVFLELKGGALTSILLLGIPFLVVLFSTMEPQNFKKSKKSN